jgi:WD40 repeat protein
MVLSSPLAAQPILPSRSMKADGDSTAVTSLEFSENGYFPASATVSAVHIWDLQSQALSAEIKPPVDEEEAVSRGLWTREASVCME